MKLSSFPLLSVALGLAGILSFSSKTAQAADHFNLEEGLPVEVEDAYPLPYHGRELQGIFRYDRADDGKNSFLIEPRLEYGFAPNWQGRIAVPFEFGSAVEDGIGDVGVEVFYNFNAESLSLPAFAISVGADLPTGRDSAGIDPTLKFIATKTLGTGENLDRLHLNLSYRYNDQRQANERSHGFGAVLGYSRRLNPETILVGDLVYEQEKEEGKDGLLAELGIRYQRSPLDVLSIGAGVGLTGDAPDFRLTFGIQRSF